MKGNENRDSDNFHYSFSVNHSNSDFLGLKQTIT